MVHADPGYKLWRLRTPNFLYSNWLDPARMETVVWYTPIPSLVFYSHRIYCVDQWNVAEDIGWPVLYASGGSATIRDFEV